MSITITPLQNAQTPFQGVNMDQTVIDIWFVVACSGSYPAGGDLMDFSQLGDLLQTNMYAPLWVEIQSMKPGGVSGNVYDYSPAASNPTMKNGLFQLLKSAAAGTIPSLVDAGAQAYPVSVVNDTIIGHANFIRL